MKPKTINVRLLLQAKEYFIFKSYGRLVDDMDRKNQEKVFSFIGYVVLMQR